MKIIWVMGCNGVGKSTLMDTVDVGFKEYGTIQVGKMMRAKYPPSHFQGQNNPKHTADEAWKMLLDGLAAHYVAGKKKVFVDGQPRDIQQVRDCRRLWPDSKYIHLFADDKTRQERCRTRDGDDSEKLALAIARHDSDSINNYKVICELMAEHQRIDTIDTSDAFDKDDRYEFYRRIICINAIGEVI